MNYTTQEHDFHIKQHR